MTKKPWFKFFPSDWLGDPKLRLCSYGARGLWIGLISIMHEAEPYGHLIIGGNDHPSAHAIGVATGGAYQTVTAHLSELVTAGVCGVTSEGVIYSRKMVRDHAKSLKAKEDGIRGGNPTLKGGVKGGLKPHMPEAIKPIEEERAQAARAAAEGKPSPTPSAAEGGTMAPTPVAPAPSPYAFERGRVCFTHADYAELERSFKHIDVPGALVALSNLCVDKRDWHGFILNALAKRNQVAKERIELEKSKIVTKPVRDWVD